MKKQKGQYGYRDSHRRMSLMLVLLFLAAILAQLAARQLTDQQAAKNILTVMAILTVLPMANLASPLIASWKYRTPPEDFYQKTRPYEEKCVILYDLVVTTKEFVIPIDAAAVHPQGVYAYCPASHLDTAKAEKALNALFTANRLEPSLKLLREERSFFRRLDSLKPADACEDDGSVPYAAKLMKNISM